MPGFGVPSAFHSFHGFVFISPSAYIVCTSRSFGYFCCDAAHRLDVIVEQRPAVRRIHLSVPAISLRHRVDQRPLDRRRTTRIRLALRTASMPTRARGELIIGML